ncbi:MAG TPA: citramalate synthase, partial [Alphaproteobacteria bacterium]|nr:citramalate synthase [Alphaproteobacteria bacterium]
PGRSANNDEGLAAVLNARASACCLVGKTWDYQVDVALEIPREDNLAAIRESMQAVAARGQEALFDAEHYFDGYKANPDYAWAALKAALDGGARWLVLCDTNGGALPAEVGRIVAETARVVGGDRLGIHTHNDTDNAVANTLAAIDAGARHIQGTINGLGERCGNANLISLIPTLLLKAPYKDQFETGIAPEKLKEIGHLSRLLDEILNRAPNRHQPYVGANAFAHKGGLHASAVMKDPRTYEHVAPESVGNIRKIPVSDQAGRSNLVARLSAFGLNPDPKDPRVAQLLTLIKEREHLGFTYDGVEASLELLARRALGQVPDFFTVESFKVSVERRHNAKGEIVTVSEAVVKLFVDGQRIMSVGEGNGPVHALDNALRKDLGRYSERLADLRLVDYKVRILTGGTEAVTRVMIESADSAGRRWSTVGVSPNIVDASFEALVDSMTFKLCQADPGLTAA